MSPEKDRVPVTVADRRLNSEDKEKGTPSAADPGREPGRAARSRPRPSGTPVRINCNFCGADMSTHCLSANLILPQPMPNGQIGFAPQTIYFTPLACPACKEALVYNSPIAVAQSS